jgi:hypothetical protein
VLLLFFFQAQLVEIAVEGLLVDEGFPAWPLEGKREISVDEWCGGLGKMGMGMGMGMGKGTGTYWGGCESFPPTQ